MKRIGMHCGASVSQRGNKIILKGEGNAVFAAKRALEQVYLVAQNGNELDESKTLGDLEIPDGATLLLVLVGAVVV